VRRRLVASCACFAVAALAVLLARDVWVWHTALRDADLRAEVRPVDADSWSADAVVPFGLARTLLGIDDDLDYRVLVSRASDLAAGRQSRDQDVRQLPVELDLARLKAGGDRVRASQAATLRGVLVYNRPAQPGRQRPEEKAVRAFQRAVELDPSNETAKHDLELVLRQLRRTPERRARVGVSGGDRVGRSGAGIAEPGHGY
jgi:hypothetical protein